MSNLESITINISPEDRQVLNRLKEYYTGISPEKDAEVDDELAITLWLQRTQHQIDILNPDTIEPRTNPNIKYMH